MPIADEATEFLIIRHGQSAGDLEERHEGRADLPLTDQGRAQARAAAAWIAAQVPPDRILSSPLRRAAETAAILGVQLALPVVHLDELMEFNNGVLAGLTYAEGAARYPAPPGGRKAHEPVPDGECDITFRARAELLWSRLVDETPRGQRLAIVAHGGIINMLFRAFVNLPLDTPVRCVTGDTGIHLWRIEGSARYILFTNRADHLAGTDASQNW